MSTDSSSVEPSGKGSSQQQPEAALIASEKPTADVVRDMLWRYIEGRKLDERDSHLLNVALGVLQRHALYGECCPNCASLQAGDQSGAYEKRPYPPVTPDTIGPSE